MPFSPLRFLPSTRGLLPPSFFPSGLRLALLPQSSPTFDAHDSSPCFSLRELRHMSLRSAPVCGCIVDGIPVDPQKNVSQRAVGHQTLP